MTKVRPKIFLGHEYDAHMQEIHKNGITVSFNVAHDLNDPIYWVKEKCLTVKVGLSDDRKNSPAMIELAITTLGFLIEAGHTVLIHCRAGCSRSPFILAHYLSRVENKPYNDLWEEIRTLRPEVLKRSKLAPNPYE
jgi:predicted protein tyrosine phosphatase